MIGAIAGDIIGSVYERHRVKTKDFALFPPGSRFTDDTVLTVALAEAILTGRDYGDLMKAYYRRYPHAGYGGMFRQWARVQGSPPYNSFGNGSAMRISPVGHASESLRDVLEKAGHFSAFTHNHPEGIKGAQATALVIWLARAGADKEAIRARIRRDFYRLEQTVDQIRPHYGFNESCQGTVPQAIQCFLEAGDFEDALRTAVSIGGDSDTLACIAGAMAEAFFGVPEPLWEAARGYLDARLTEVYQAWEAFCPPVRGR